jgi:hypothetical protein
VGALVKMRFGTTDVVATVLEDRGPLGVGGRRIVRVQFFLEAAEEPIDTEVPAEKLTLVALPGDPADRRIGVEGGAGEGFVGTYTAPDGKVAVVTDEMPTPDEAHRAALRWVKAGLAKDRRSRARESVPFIWRPDRRHPGRYAVYRQGRLGEELVREPSRARR